MYKRTLIIFVILLLIASIIYVISYIAAYKTLHKERQSIKKTPSDYGLTYENIEFQSFDNLKLKGWWIQGKGNTNKVIIVAHGYASNRAGWTGIEKGDDKIQYLDWLAPAPNLVNAGYSMLYFDMRASGESEGNLITLAKLESKDLLSAVNWQLKNKHKKEIGLLGFSMGGNTVLRSAIELVKMKNKNTIKGLAIICIGPYKYTTMVNKSLQYWTSLPFFLAH